MKHLRLLYLSALLCCGMSVLAGDFDYNGATGAPAGADVYTVSNEAEFVAALGSDRVVKLAPGVRLNLSRILNDEEFFCNEGRAWSDDLAPDEILTFDSGVAISDNVFDGRQLKLVKMRDLTIRGSKGCSIVVEPRYACVLHLFDCYNVRIENLTMGHTEEGYCQGAVVGMDGTRRVTVEACDLYGCGTYGVEAYRSGQFVMSSSIIHDCSYGIMELIECEQMDFRRCDFMRNREFTLLSGTMNKSVSFTDCRFYANHADAPLFSENFYVDLDNCVINHPTAKLGDLEKTRSYNHESEWNDDATLYPEVREDIGPR